MKDREPPITGSEHRTTTERDILLPVPQPYVLRSTVFVPRPRQEVFTFFARAENLGTLTPPELGFRIITSLPIVMEAGAIIDYTIRLWKFPMVWRTRITTWEPPLRFVDEQLRGPYRQWTHQHTFIEVEGGTRIEDEVHYRLPFGIIGRVIAPAIRLQLGRIFRYRESTVQSLFPPLRSSR
jgi:ligand-binding SRPBCC domain-containing protein